MKTRNKKVLAKLMSVTLAAATVITPAAANLTVAEAATTGAWVQSGSQWWYRNADGTYPASAWKQINGAWYYFNAAGYMTTGWQQIGGSWYYMNANGAMTTGWQKVNGSWYYMNANGAMTTGWQKINGSWYYMNASGVMTTGWQQIGSSWYYMNEDGTMAYDTWIGTYYVDENGAWDPSIVPEKDLAFDFEEQIAQEQEEAVLVPEAANINIAAVDENDASGVELVQYEGSEDYYLNAMVGGDKITFTSWNEESAVIVSATSQVGENAARKLRVKNGMVSITPETLMADTDERVDQVITITMSDDTVYKVHTDNMHLPTIDITGTGVSADDEGVYTFAIDRFMLRVNTDGELIYYRDMNCVGEETNELDEEKEFMCENFSAQETEDGNFYGMFVELHSEYRNANGGYSSGEYVIMDDNYRDVDTLTLLPTDTHGVGYLDQHECVVLGEGHYLVLSYSPELVYNLTDTCTGIIDEDGIDTKSAYVWAGIIQEIKDGEVVQEISTTDYPFLYDTAVENRDYTDSTDQGWDNVSAGTSTVFSLAAGWQDYVHVNAIDYQLDDDGNVAKLLVSMRNQCAVYQFDMTTKNVDWILGGKAESQLDITNAEEVTSTRKDEDGTAFTALTYGQHDARYCGTDEDGNIVISVFDNQTGIGPFLTTETYPGAATTETRTFQAVINEDELTATIENIVEGTALNKLSDKYHITSHCGSANYQNFDQTGSVLIGWGLHGVIDNLPAYPNVGQIDTNFSETTRLHMGSRPIFTEYNMDNDEITFELSVSRNANLKPQEALFSYRTYKTAE